MKVFLVVLSVWDMAYRGMNITPAFVQEMPSIEACEAVKASILRMGLNKSFAPRVDCVAVKQKDTPQ